MSDLRLSLKNVIDDIIREIPAVDPYLLTICELKAERSSILYKAPEILSNSIYSILNILASAFPLNMEDDSKNLQWIKKIRDIWNIFTAKYKDGFTPTVTPKQISVTHVDDE